MSRPLPGTRSRGLQLGGLASVLVFATALVAVGAALAQTPGEPAADEPQELCHDRVDNDGDGLVDCDDVDDCKAFPTCGWILGGWLWVGAIYDVTLGVLVLYAWLITVRLRRARAPEALSHD